MREKGTKERRRIQSAGNRHTLSSGGIRYNQIFLTKNAKFLYYSSGEPLKRMFLVCLRVCSLAGVMRQLVKVMSSA